LVISPNLHVKETSNKLRLFTFHSHKVHFVHFVALDSKGLLYFKSGRYREIDHRAMSPAFAVKPLFPPDPNEISMLMIDISKMYRYKQKKQKKTNHKK